MLNNNHVLSPCVKLIATLVTLLTLSVSHYALANTGANMSLYEDASNTMHNIDEDGMIRIRVGEQALKVAYADEPMERQLGLMYRRSMCENCGMLFKFDTVRIGSIWMKNTYIPLDLAYIDEQGEIIDIQALTPHDLRAVKSPKPVLYALEMNQGWFAKNSVKVGDTLTILN